MAKQIVLPEALAVISEDDKQGAFVQSGRLVLVDQVFEKVILIVKGIQIGVVLIITVVALPAIT